MADQKPSLFTPAGTLNDADGLPLVRPGTQVLSTLAGLKIYLQSGAGAPILSASTAVATSTTTATLGVTTTGTNGTLYVVATLSATPPSAAQIKAGQDHTGAAASYAANQAVGVAGTKSFSA